MPLSLNEIRDRALAFSKEWEDETNEDAEAKSFWDGFFSIFGITRRRTATFETKVHKGNDRDGYIDLIWKGVMLIEHKSRGKDLTRAYEQAKDYFPGLKEHELPRYIVVCDFARFHVYDLEEGWNKEFKLSKLVDNLHLFDFLSGYKRHTYKEQDPVNIDAAELMGKLHDQLKTIGYTGHELEVYLVRLLFCLFADDTNIFEKGLFEDYVTLSAEDGSDLAARLAQLFEILNTSKDHRFKNMDAVLDAFPYVNGRLFEERLRTASFDRKMRQALLECCYLDWSKISPAIFGSLFQSVMDEKARRNLGAHYTSEKNIMKLIKPLFLDELWAEFHRIDSRPKMQQFHDKLRGLRFLDPACGCGNFLIIAYRELRLLEIKVVSYLLKDRLERRQKITDINIYFEVDVDQFYGIEYEEFPAQIAQVAMWLIDHQMNQMVSEEFGEYYVRLPLRKSATIVHGNALGIDWQSLLGDVVEKYNYILGNPPFIGSRLMSQQQRDDVIRICENSDDSGLLDYVSAWYVKAATYIKGSKTEVAFVSTNSIVQGEQTSILWRQMQNKYSIKINFAHRTFKWSNEAKNNAAVYCVIIGFANFNREIKLIYDYSDIRGEAHEVKAKNINAYLVDAKDLFIDKSLKPICNVPSLIRGSIPYDDGHLLLSKEEANKILDDHKELSNYIKLYGGANEFINNKWRYCFWLKDAPPELLRHNNIIKERIEKVFEFRTNSKGQSVKSKAKTPSLFGDIRQPSGSNYLLIPRHSSEKRKYIPIGFVDQSVILADSAYGLPDASLYHFGILNSEMHMAWVTHVCGRLKSDYRYSANIVYNNYPWPPTINEKQIAAIEKAAQKVLDVRNEFLNSTLADLYDPMTMPLSLNKAHQALDKAVDLCYRPQAFTSETKRIEYLFELYDKYTAGLFVTPKKTIGKDPYGVKKEILRQGVSLREWRSLEMHEDVGNWINKKQPRIICSISSKHQSFHYESEAGFQFSDVTFVLTGEHLKYLTCFLNSKLFEYCFNGIKSAEAFFDTVKLKQVSLLEEQQFAKMLDYINGLRKEINNRSVSESLNSSDEFILIYFEQVMNALFYELYFNSEFKSNKLEIAKYIKELPQLNNGANNLYQIRQVFIDINKQEHPVRQAVFSMLALPQVAIFNKLPTH